MEERVMKKARGSRLGGRKILVGVTGCIAAYKACELVSRLVQAGASVRTVMTREAREFVTPLSFRVLSGSPVFTEMFEAPREFDPVHVSLADWAELIVIAPATANIIGKIACGIADDLLSCTVMATKEPVLIAPAMNTGMWENGVVQANVRKLKDLGYRFIGPERGYLACGDEGIGRLTATDDIIREIERLI
jgi:phosphopantothenoylcysteine decarboxylase/phosphopantothenate--cysteine ligase